MNLFKIITIKIIVSNQANGIYSESVTTAMIELLKDSKISLSNQEINFSQRSYSFSSKKNASFFFRYKSIKTLA
jgi:hypothetical protein